MTEEAAQRPKTLTALAAALGVYRTTPYKWGADALEELRGPDGAFDVEEVRAWAAARKVARRRKSRPPMSMRVNETHDAAKAKTDTAGELDQGQLEGERDWSNVYRRARAIRETLSVKQLQDQVIDRGQVDEMFAERVREVKQALMSIGRRLAPRLVGLEPREIEVVITKEARRICQNYARPIQLEE
ncbi:MAG TPA: hypothetical protein EYN40_05090 [Planctomycetes bacterium]|nr:hypothetical protein [Planctomycetota bacterium]